MKYSLTKEEVFEAILTEPVLIAGAWYRYNYNEKTNTKTHCSACALGAVAFAATRGKRGYLGWDEFFDLTDSNCVSEDVEASYETGNFNSILSSEFELAYDEGIDEHFARFHALMIVEAMCPDVLEFKI